MASNFSSLLINKSFGRLDNMPPVSIENRITDKKVLYNMNKTRLDRLAGDFYEDETLWKLILWANPDYECEFDIPDDTIIRIPWPKNDVLMEVTTKIVTEKNLG